MTVSLPRLPTFRTQAAAPRATAPREIDPALIEEYLRQTQSKSLLGTLWSGVSNVFDVLSRPAYAMGNIAAGDLPAAGRAMIPFGQTIENMTGLNTGLAPEERKTVSQTFGMGEKEPWWLRVPVNLGIDIATDPTTYLTSGLTSYGRAASAAGKGVTKLDDVARLLTAAKQSGNVRQVGVLQKSYDTLKAVAATGKPIGLVATKSGQAAVGQRALLKFMGHPIIKGEKFYATTGAFRKAFEATKTGQMLRRSFSTKKGVPAIDEILEQARNSKEFTVEEVDRIALRLQGLEQTIAKTGGDKGLLDTLEHLDVKRRAGQLDDLLNELPPDLSTKLRDYVGVSQSALRPQGVPVLAASGPREAQMIAKAELDDIVGLMRSTLDDPELLKTLPPQAVAGTRDTLTRAEKALRWIDEGIVPKPEVLPKLNPTQREYVNLTRSTFDRLHQAQKSAGIDIKYQDRFLPHISSRETKELFEKVGEPYKAYKPGQPRGWEGSLREFNEMVDDYQSYITGHKQLTKPLGDVQRFAKEFGLRDINPQRADFFMAKPSSLLALYGRGAAEEMSERFLTAKAIQKFSKAKLPLGNPKIIQQVMNRPEFEGHALFVPKARMRKALNAMGGEDAALIAAAIAESGPEANAFVHVPVNMVEKFSGYGFVMPVEVVRTLGQADDAILRLPEVLKVFDKVQGIWKANTLAYFPSYHARNIISDMVNTTAHGVRPGAWVDALELMRGKPMQIAYRSNQGSVRVAKNADEILRLFAQNGVVDMGQTAEIISQLRGGVGKLDKIIGTANPIIKSGMKFGRRRENLGRIAVAVDALQQGFTPYEAGQRAAAALYDYKHLAPADQFLRKFLPFYTWMRRNIPEQIRIAMHSPGYPAAMQKLSDVSGATQEAQQGNIPPWLADRMPVKVGESAFPMESYLPMADLGKLQRPGSAFMEQVSPFIRTPMELAQNRSWFFDQPISNVPGEKEKLMGLNIPKGASYVAKNMRLISEMDRLLFKPTAGGPIRSLTGVRVYPIERERQQRQLDFQKREYVTRLRYAYKQAYQRGDESEVRRLGSMLTALSSTVPETQ